MKAFAICGITNSGKTTTTEYILNELIRRDYRVGSVKYIHCDDFELDNNPSTDTRRHRMAGSGLVAAHAKGETNLMFPNRISTEKLLSFYEDECDWVVLEGVSDILVPTIVTAHNEEDLQMKWSDMVFCISGCISAGMDEYHGVPAIDATTNIIDLVDLIEDRVYHWQPNFDAVRYLINNLQYPAHTVRF